MNYLLDTHTLIWYLNGDKNLSSDSKIAIDNPENSKFVSIASIWEIAIKISLKKLFLSVSIEELIEAIDKSQINVLEIRIPHLVQISKLEYIHRDPFDRLLVSQAILESMVLITKDENIKKYNAETLW